MEKATTLVLREDIKQVIEREFGKRQLSNVINRILFREFMAGKKESLFGADKWLTPKKIKGARDHHDRL
jgi:hypothetical protein